VITWRRLYPDGDAVMLHGWVTRPEARFWGMLGATVDDVRQAYREIDASPHHEARIGELDGVPVCLFERYDPALSELAGVYAVRKGDVGMHFFVAPTDRPVHGFTRAVLRAVMDEIFADPTARRVVAEPDVDNVRVQRLNASVGFTVEREIELPDKTALLSFCTRHDYTCGPHPRGRRGDAA
jgi:RimJ/RimL family protein N-acetyltransferase